MGMDVAVHGAAGRMGRAVIEVVQQAEDLRLAAALDAPGSAQLGVDAGMLAGAGEIGVPVGDSMAALKACDVVVDFSLPAALPRLFDACAEYRTPLVLATTGLDETLEARLDTLAQTQPVVAAPNYSTGVAVLFHLARQAAQLLPDFDLEIVEMHHRHKVDSPSGTALKLLQTVADARGQVASEVAVYGREGQVGARTDSEIGVMTLRGGDVVGEHSLLVSGPGERVEVTHRATNRAIFARGAVRAARWVVGKPPGRYVMDDVLGLRQG